MPRLLFALLGLMIVCGPRPMPCAAEELSFPLRGQRILFLGDSITHAGRYVSLIETQLRLQGLDPLPEIINLGLGSETCSGLSEPGHPFPRPDVHTRVDRALELIRPDVVVACYGMNDGIYHPFAEDRFAAYRRGIERLVDKVHRSGAKIVLLTPPPFDPVPLKESGKLQPEGAKQYAYFAMYENYDDVLKTYGQWLLGRLPDVPPPTADLVIDVHGPTHAYLSEQRKRDPQFTVAKDGIHPNEEGHRIIAETVLRGLGVESWREPAEELWRRIADRGRILHGAWLSHVGHQRPGTRAGLPLPAAEQKVAALEAEIEPLVREARKPTVDRRDSQGGTVHSIHYPATLAPEELSIEVEYFLWVPEDVETVRGIIVHQHGCGRGASLGGRTAADDLHWQALARKWDCALLGSSYEPREGINCRLWCDPRRGSDARFREALTHFASATGHPEIDAVPWCLWGHSGGAFWASLMQTLHPERIVAVWLRSGTAFGYWTKGEIEAPLLSAVVDSIPVMCNPGIEEKTHERFHNAWDGGWAMFQNYRARGAPIGFAPDPRTSHQCGDSRYLAIPFFDACLAARLPDPSSRDQRLREMPTEPAWLAEPLTDRASSASTYSGDPKAAVWLPNERVAKAWTEYVRTGACSDDTPPTAPTSLQLIRLPDGNVRFTWECEADLESGLQKFMILRDTEFYADVPEQPRNPFGRPLFQGMSYHDTPIEPVATMSIDLPLNEVEGHLFKIVSFNSVGLRSPLSETVTLPPPERN